MFKFLKRIFQSEPTNRELRDELDALINEWILFKSEIYGQIEDVLQPLSKRLATRKTKSLNSADTLEKQQRKSIISPREAELRKQYGIA
jgi:uncharacterized membrane protein affecting hemolysin expression